MHAYSDKTKRPLHRHQKLLADEGLITGLGHHTPPIRPIEAEASQIFGRARFLAAGYRQSTIVSSCPTSYPISHQANLYPTLLRSPTILGNRTLPTAPQPPRQMVLSLVDSATCFSQFANSSPSLNVAAANRRPKNQKGSRPLSLVSLYLELYLFLPVLQRENHAPNRGQGVEDATTLKFSPFSRHEPSFVSP